MLNAICRSPRGGRGLKLYHLARLPDATRRSPRGGRGLKYATSMKIVSNS